MPFNGYLKSVILRISEAHDLGESNRFALYDHTKTYIAAPPDTHRVNEKYLLAHYVINVCGVIITSNHLTDGIYLPADDRRHYVAWSELIKEEFSKEYFDGMFNWYKNGGNEHVAAYLAKLDLSDFNAKAPPPKTEAFWRIVNANRTTEEGELEDVIDKLGNPAAFTIDEVANVADGQLRDWLKDQKNRRILPHRFELVGYIPVRNPAAESGGGLWKIAKVKNGFINNQLRPLSIERERKVIYVQKTLTIQDQFKAAARLRDDATAKAQDILAKDKDKAEAEAKAKTEARAAKEETAKVKAELRNSRGQRQPPSLYHGKN